MTAAFWPALVLWASVALMVVLMVRLLRARRQPWWVIVLGGIGAAVATYVAGIAVLIAVSTLLFSHGFVPAY